MENKEAEKETLPEPGKEKKDAKSSSKDDRELVEKQLEKLVYHFESLRIAQYLELLEKPWRLIASNFIAGIARGLGIALGASLVFALVLAFLKQLIVLNIPVIGNFIGEILKIVEKRGGTF